jgi:hypothetical protein
MKTADLTANLKRMSDQARHGGQVTAIHLFGIKYARELEGQPLKEIAILATSRESYYAEIRKGMNLAKHVSLL